MKDSEIIQHLPVAPPWPEGSLTLLVREEAVSVLPEGYKWREGDRVVAYKFSYGSIESENIPLTDFPPESVTAEEWLSAQGYSSMRLVTLLDLENQLASVLGNSPKLIAVRTWINGVLATFIQNPAPRSNWPPAPFTFEETTQEAWLAL